MKPTSDTAQFKLILQEEIERSPANDDQIVENVVRRMVQGASDLPGVALWGLRHFVRDRLNLIDRSARSLAHEAVKSGDQRQLPALTRLRQEAVVRGREQLTNGRGAVRANIVAAFGPMLRMPFNGVPLGSMTKAEVLEVAGNRKRTGETYVMQAEYLRKISIKMPDEGVVADVWSEVELGALYRTAMVAHAAAV